MIGEPVSKQDVTHWENVILPHVKDLHKIDVYKARGGYGAFKKALAMKPEEVIDLVKKSNLRGRGGACSHGRQGGMERDAFRIIRVPEKPCSREHPEKQSMA